VPLIGIWLQRVAVGWLTWPLTHSGMARLKQRQIAASLEDSADGDAPELVPAPAKPGA
jgi:hypothetical protein